MILGPDVCFSFYTQEDAKFVLGFYTGRFVLGRFVLVTTSRKTRGLPKGSLENRGNTGKCVLPRQHQESAGRVP